MTVEHTTTIVLFKALSDVMRLLRESLISLRNAYGSRLHSVTLQATPGLWPTHAFSFFLDAELPEATTTGQAWLGLTIEIRVSAEQEYVADGAIGWHRQDAVALCANVA